MLARVDFQAWVTKMTCLTPVLFYLRPWGLAVWRTWQFLIKPWRRSRLANILFPKVQQSSAACTMPCKMRSMYFKNPEIFNPSRFIDENGKFVHDEHVIPFGLGKRYCLGQSLAEKEFFIFFTGLLQQFEVSSAPGTTLPSYIDIFPEEALVRSPPNYQVILKKRIWPSILLVF